MRMRPWVRVATFLLSIFAVGVATSILLNPRSRTVEELLVKFSDAGVTVAVITVAGALVTGSFRLLEERRTRDQERRRVFHEVVDAHNEVKLVRRSLAALGLHNRRPVIASGRRQDPLSAEEAKELRAAMARLIGAQLRFEAINREVGQSDFFRRKGDVSKVLGDVEGYLNKHVVDKWEDYGSAIWADARPETIERLGLRVSMAGNSQLTFRSRLSGLR